jgi:phytoene dehydrogenase-like protein
VREWDAVVVGSGPNGLGAAVTLARAGCSVLVLEAAERPGGATRTVELTLPGYLHDHCSAVHPMGILSPLFRSLPLAAHGLRWLQSPVSCAHPLPDQPAVLLSSDVDETAAGLGVDAGAYRSMVSPFLDDPHPFLADLLAPLGVPSQPIRMSRFGLTAVRSAVGVARSRFRGERARALFAGAAGHSILPLESPVSAAFGLIFCMTAHIEAWPVAEGGSAAITTALCSLLQSLGGEVRCGVRVSSLDDLPPARAVLFDTSPRALAQIAGEALPSRYRARLERYRYGPGVCKVDLALSEPIPWSDPRVGTASTVHVGGTLEEIAASERAPWQGKVPDNPYLILCQQSALDPTRAPAGRHTGYAYCHVPPGCTEDASERILAAIERFAPGFRDCILARHTSTAAQLEASNANLVGGAITGGAADWSQLFTRPVARISPHSTPNPRLFLCSASTPPGGGVHGMCGYHAAYAALRGPLATRGQLQTAPG